MPAVNFRFYKSGMLLSEETYPCNAISIYTLLLLLKGELQRPNRLISSERPFKILQNETKIIKIHQGVLEIFNFTDGDSDSFPRTTKEKMKMFFLEQGC